MSRGTRISLQPGKRDFALYEGHSISMNRRVGISPPRGSSRCTSSEIAHPTKTRFTMEQHNLTGSQLSNSSPLFRCSTTATSFARFFTAPLFACFEVRRPPTSPRPGGPRPRRHRADVDVGRPFLEERDRRSGYVIYVFFLYILEN